MATINLMFLQPYALPQEVMRNDVQYTSMCTEPIMPQHTTYIINIHVACN